MIYKNLTALFLLFISICALSLAIVMEYGLGFSPCILCIYERWPYFIMLLFSVVMIVKPASKKAMFILVIISCAAGIILTGYHIGVEHRIFKGPTSCSSSINRDVGTIEGLKEQLIANEIVRCDVAQKLFNIPITYLNFICLIIVISIAFILKHYEQRKSATPDNKS